MTDAAATNPVRVGYLTSQYPATSHTFIRREVAALRRRGVDVHNFSVRPAALSDTAGDEDRQEAAETFTLLGQSALSFVTAQLWGLFTGPARYFGTFALALRHRPPGLRGLALSLAHFAESLVLARELDRRSLNHLHNHFANSAATVGLLATRFLGCRWSFVIHGPSETDYPAGYLLGQKILAADRVICAHWFGRSQGMRLVPYDQWAKFHVVHCGVNLGALPEPGAPRDANQIICVGRLASDKAQAGLLEAFARVKQRYPQATLKLVGGGPDQAELEAIASRLGIGGAVEFTGPLPEPDTLRAVQASGMMVLPSFWEGLPVVLMEALALGVPAITSRIAGVPELIEHGENGLLFTPANWSELEQCMLRLFTEPGLGERLARAGRDSITREFDVDKSAEQLERIFGELHARTGTGK